MKPTPKTTNILQVIIGWILIFAIALGGALGSIKIVSAALIVYLSIDVYTSYQYRKKHRFKNKNLDQN
jgi:uncharacterized membrane protein YoaK (UPF0700 family)